MSQRENERQAEYAEQWVAKVYEVEHAPGESDWYDCVSTTGTKYEVKSTTERLSDGSPGRFRLWEDQHRSLVKSDGRGTAWYVFVLFERSGAIADHRRVSPGTVTALVEREGGWNRAGHSERPGKQLKVPHSRIL